MLHLYVQCSSFVIFSTLLFADVNVLIAYCSSVGVCVTPTTSAAFVRVLFNIFTAPPVLYQTLCWFCAFMKRNLNFKMLSLKLMFEEYVL